MKRHSADEEIIPCETSINILKNSGSRQFFQTHENWDRNVQKKHFQFFRFFLGSRQFFQTHDKFSDYLSIRICTNNIFLGAPRVSEDVDGIAENNKTAETRTTTLRTRSKVSRGSPIGEEEEVCVKDDAVVADSETDSSGKGLTTNFQTT